MENGIFEPKPSVQTISNAMDVGNPSNFDRINKLFNQDLYRLKNVCSSYFFSDKETHKAMQEIYENFTAMWQILMELLDTWACKNTLKIIQIIMAYF